MSATGHVEVKESSINGAGRGLFATKDFKAGDVVVLVDRPLTLELNVECLRDSCAWCLQRGATDPQERAQAASMGLPAGFIEVKSCTGCRKVSYCSKKCQAKAWKADHKYECKVLSPSERPDLPDAVRAVIKLLGRLKAEGSKDQRLMDALSFRPFSGDGKGLEQFSKRNKKLFDDFTMLGFAAWKYAGEPKLEGVDSQIVAKAFLFNVISNKFNLASPLDDVHLGIGFDPLICIANHSCEPNAHLVFNQPTMVLRALRPIKKGDEIFIKYVDVTNPFTVRQSELQETFYFSCQCPRCKKGATGPEDKFSMPASELSASYRTMADNLVKRHEERLSKFFAPADNERDQERLAALQAEAFSVLGNSANPNDHRLDEIKRALKMCIESGLWSWIRQPVPQLCRQLFTMYIANGDPYRAFRLGLKIYFQITPDLYPPKFSSDALINAWTMSTVTNVLCGPSFKDIYDEMQRSGLDLRIVYFGFLFDVYDNIPQMFGYDSPFGRVVKSTYDQIMAGVSIHESEIRDKIRSIWPSLETIGRSVNVSSL